GVAMVVSSVKVKLALAVLPAVSVSVTTTVWLPSAAGAVYVAEAGPPSMLKLRVTSAAAATAVSAASVVILSAMRGPASLLSAIVGVAMVVSSVKVKLALAVLPAVSVSVTTTV